MLKKKKKKIVILSLIITKKKKKLIYTPCVGKKTFISQSRNSNIKKVCYLIKKRSVT